MANSFIAWVVMDFDGAASQSVLVRETGQTVPADYRIPKNVRDVRVRMIGVDPRLSVEVAGDRFVVHHLSQPASHAKDTSSQTSPPTAERASRKLAEGVSPAPG